MRERKEILKELSLLQGNLESLKWELSQYPWDNETKLFKLLAKDFSNILRSAINNEIDFQTLINWADTIECRDDIEFENEGIQEFVFELANPEINGELTKERLSEIVAELDK